MSIPRRLFHTILNTNSTWLHGDPRGYRSRDHRIHSSDDYKNPPPIQENGGLYVYQLSHAAEPTILPVTAFAVIGNAIMENLMSRGHDVEAGAVNPTHAHQLVWLTDDVKQIKTILGWVKRFATRAARERIGELREVEIWAEGETIKPIKDDEHRANARDYILTKQGADAWTWCPDVPPSC